jgi:large repetitive protein
MLVSATTNQDLRVLTDGSTINRATDGSRLNVRADANASVASVVFKLDGAVFRTESFAPFALAGDTNGVYNAWTPSVGSHTLLVTPYSAANGTGTAGPSILVHFTVQ